MLDYLDDLESDFSRFHRIDDIYQLDGPRFFRMAWRISAYGGVMSMRLDAQQREAQPTPAPAHQSAPAAPAGRDNVVDLVAFQASQPGLIERVKVGGA